MGMSGGSGGGPMGDINVTPLVDVMLVLLIIFMVNAPMINAGVDLEMPQVNAPPTQMEPHQLALAHDEHRRGTLAPGKLADLVVLDRDPVTCPEDWLPQLTVLATLMGGRMTYVSGTGIPGIETRS